MAARDEDSLLPSEVAGVAGEAGWAGDCALISCTVPHRFVLNYPTLARMPTEPKCLPRLGVECLEQFWV